MITWNFLKIYIKNGNITTYKIFLHACPLLQQKWLVWSLKALSTLLRSCRAGQFPNYTVPGQIELSKLTSTVHFLSPETALLESADWKERPRKHFMISPRECFRTRRGSNLQPLDHQFDVRLTESPRPTHSILEGHLRAMNTPTKANKRAINGPISLTWILAQSIAKLSSF